MNRIKRFAAAAFTAILAFSALLQQPASAQQKMTYLYAERDTTRLFLDVLEPAKGSVTSLDGKEKPTILFVFGGGFITGSRDDKFYQKWFECMTSEGYRVVSIDYRLKLKGLKLKPIRDRAVFMEAVDAAVEDLISATAFIIENAEELNIDPDNIVTMGSSAGAMTVLSADYELCNRTEMVSSLPAGFRFKGVIPFAGAILRDDGRPSYKENPAPTLFLHGKDDKVVPYKGFSLFRYSLWGSDKLAGLFAKKGYPYWIIRYNNHGHEVSSAMVEAWQYVSSFIEDEVMAGNHRIVDTSVTDDSFKRWESQSTADLYK